MSIIEQILKLVTEGILSSEHCPEPNYWHWSVLRPEDLPSNLTPLYKAYGEIRWYGSEA